MKKRLILAALLSVGVLVGCGNTGSSSEPSSEPTSSEVSSESSSEASSESSSEENSESSSEASSESSSEEQRPTWGSKSSPLSVAEAAELMKNFEQTGSWSEEKGYVTGVVKAVSGPNSHGGYNVDLEDSTHTFQIYSAKLEGETPAPVAGDTVIGFGYFTKYYQKYEIAWDEAKGDCFIVDVQHNDYPVSSSIVDSEGAASTKATITDLPTTAASGSTVTFTLTVEEGFNAKVEAGGKLLTSDSNSYSFIATSNNEVKVTITEAGAPLTESSITFADCGYENGEDVTSVTLDTSTTLSFENNGGNNSSKYYNTGTAIRIYGKNVFTVSSTQNIASVELTFSSNAPTEDKCVVTGGSLNYSTYVITCDANTKVVTLSNTASSGHFRLASVKVIYTAA
ncbi:MAG: hypothetical protein E7177_00465 [Erysipelotrichaceae bacterium]|nr:hypothetical protein [Erysipelotrichaceae bacterium]